MGKSRSTFYYIGIPMTVAHSTTPVHVQSIAQSMVARDCSALLLQAAARGAPKGRVRRIAWLARQQPSP